MVPHSDRAHTGHRHTEASHVNLQQIREQPINKIREDLDELDGEQLLQLRAMEAAEDAPRATLIKAIDAKLAELGATAPASDAPTNTPPAQLTGADDATAPAVVEAPAASPAWQAPDYCGPLTGDQALWRVANLKAR